MRITGAQAARAPVDALMMQLECLPRRLYLNAMIPDFTPEFDLQDRLRLRERFFGASRTVLARL
jgi:hypothetical protein